MIRRLPPAVIPDPFPTSDEVIAVWESQKIDVQGEPGFLIDIGPDLVEFHSLRDCKILGVFRLTS